MPNNVFKLNRDTPLFMQVLKLAGWYNGRNIDISQEEIRHREYGYKLNNAMSDILSEFYNMSHIWYFRLETSCGKIIISGLDYTFTTVGVCHEYNYYKNLLPPETQSNAVPIIRAGWHQFDRSVWVCKKGLIYAYVPIENYFEVFSSIFNFMESEIEGRFRGFTDSPYEKLFVTFGKGQQLLLNWDNAGV